MWHSLSFYFLFQSIELWGSEKLSQGDLESITELFDGDSSGVFAFAVQDAFDGGLGDGRDGTELVGGDTPLSAQIQYSFGNCFPCIHVPFPRMIYH